MFGNGKMITQKEAKMIADYYDDMTKKSKVKVVDFLKADSNPDVSATSDYYDREMKAFVFDLPLIEKYIEDVKAADQGGTAKYLLIIKATNKDSFKKYSPTTILAITGSVNEKDFRIVPTTSAMLPEHPGVTGRVTIDKANGESDNKNFESGDTLIFTIE